MAVTANTIPGQLQLHWIKEQTTFDSILAYAVTDAVSGRIDTYKIDGELNYEDLNEAVGTASHQGEVQTVRGGKWAGTFLVKPAAAGTAPDIGPALLKAAFGVETITGGTSAVYTLSSTVKTPLQGCLNIANRMQHIFSGGVCEEMTIEIPANALPTISFAGSFARFGHCYEHENDEAEAQTVTEIAVADDNRGMVSPGAVIQFEDDDNSSSGYTVTAVDWTAGAAHYDITPGIAGAPGIGANEWVRPLVPSQTVGGSAIAAVACALDIDGVSLGFKKATIKMTTGWGLREPEATANRAAGIIRTGPRRIEGTIEFYAIVSDTGNMPPMGREWGELLTRDIQIRVGAATAGERMTLDFNKVLCKPAAFTIGAGAVEASMDFVARQNSAAEDEFSMTFN